MNKMHPQEMEAIAERHKDVLEKSNGNRLRRLVIWSAAALYLISCWWMFSIGDVLRGANWSIAGSYLADWVSYEVRPELEVEPDGTMTIDYGRFSPLGANPSPAWVELQHDVIQRDAPRSEAQIRQPKTSSSISFMVAPAVKDEGAASIAEPAQPSGSLSEEVVIRAAVSLGGGTNIVVANKQVRVVHAGETLVAAVDGRGTTTPEGTLPNWAVQKRAGEKITLSFGTKGWAEIDGDEVSIRRRFFGWANFIFDTNSPFFGKGAREVLALVTSGERVDPSRSNLSLAWSNFLYNAEWQHLDVWTKLLQTVVMAFVGTLFASLLAFPLCFLAARNITRSGLLNQVTKRIFDFLRSVDMLIWALFFTRAFGPGPLAGISAIFFTDTGTFGKLYSEALENIDEKQREGVKSVGAPALAVQRFGVLPQVLPVFASQSLYFWESNTRSATIIGAVGAGGIGLKLWEAMRTNSDWENVAYMVLLILIVVFIFDSISNACRSRLMGTR
ncbi:phosphate-import permease protein PhnE [Sinorhizobium sp. KGO-5]|uniref:phosphonate ABC transporter, permease protein PhnE n=1 Tax=Sinorhizobium sp. KGO-5 TaxID=1470810 RepID=UPI00294A199F|nr:phosphate-import permease protein PhnE [Sinorhizobium sp. KGO-5]